MYNRVQLIGRLGQNPKINQTNSGKTVCNFSVATNERWRDQDGTEHEETQWHNVVVWRRQAESCGKYLGKGSLVFVDGKLKYRKWTDKEGIEKLTSEIHAQQVKFLEWRDKDGGKVDQQAESDDLASMLYEE